MAKGGKAQYASLFLETPSNPLTEISDIPALAGVAKKAGALLAVDNCFCTPVLQKPLELGADIVIHSATKYLDGQGRVLGGAVLGKTSVIREGVFGFLRTAGPTLSAFNAWVILKGLETLRIRIESPIGDRARACALAGSTAACRARLLSGAADASTARAGDEAAKKRRGNRIVRCKRRPGSSMETCG